MFSTNLFYILLLIFTDFSDFLGRPSFYLLPPSSTFFYLPSTFNFLPPSSTFLGRERDPREDPLGAGRIP
jgi:hypothetical protein